jgi:hypothetical protein
MLLLLLLLLLRAPVNVEEAVARRPLLRMSPHNQRQILPKCGEQQSFPKNKRAAAARLWPHFNCTRQQSRAAEAEKWMEKAIWQLKCEVRCN